MNEILSKLETLLNVIEKNQEDKAKNDIAKNFDELKNEILKINNLTEDAKSNIAKIEVLDEQIKKMGEELDKLMKNGTITTNITNDFEKFEKELNSYFKTGEKTELITKSFSTTEGAVLVPKNRAKEIIKEIAETSPVLRDCKVYNISKGNSLEIPVRRSISKNTAAQAEGASRGTESKPVYGKLELKVGKITEYTTITSEMINDSDFNVVNEVMEASREDIATYLSDKVWNGSIGANNEFEGIYQNTTVTSGALETATKSALSWEDLKNLIYALPPKTRAKSAFYVSTEALSAMRGFKDTTGQPLYVQPLTAGEPGLFMGYKVYEDTYMQDLTDGNYPVFFGSMKDFYCMLIRNDVYMEKERNANEDTYDFYTRLRAGGKVRQTSQGKLLKIKGA